ncbi:hypothetical protein HZA98_00725 [Candidatus Woesearchaeota archaeon]|nr:hypothetical protein [Candidatus Woesearchaeota archaeon]
MIWWKILGVVIAVLLALFILYALFQESSQKYYRKARRLHKKGEQAYIHREFKDAEEYYQKAEAARKRARELE